MQKKKKGFDIGITGGIGAGKTLISSIFNNLGIPVYYADERAKFLMNHDEKLIREITEFFGPDTYLNGRLNRSYLSSHVFINRDKLDQLNELVHPAVREDYLQWRQNHLEMPYTLKEAALLFETGSYKELEQTILIYAPLPLRIERTLLRDPHRTKKDIEKIIDNQMPDEEKKKLADHIIYNDDTRLVIPQVLKIHHQFMDAFKDRIR
jgi:dephospho-CoA kinase